MAFDYTNFKTPYFDLEIGDSSWSIKQKLPEYLLRLVTKIEVMESFYTSDHDGATTITIGFTEGFEKKSGFITDLIFDSKQGITTLGADDKKSSNASPRFLFQEKNLIKITWGYLENRQSVRSVMCYIIQAATNFSESSAATTTITCGPWSSFAGDQLSTKDGKPFGTMTKLSKAGDSLLVFEDLKTDVLIRKIAKDLKMTTIISENLHNDIVDKGKQKMWVAGESFHQFMTRLAKASGCTYGIKVDPKTGKNVIIFIKKSDFEKRAVIDDPNLLYWKQPGNILKSISLTANFGGALGNSQKGVDSEGKPLVDDKIEREVLKNANKDTSVPSAPLRVQQKSSTTKKPQLLIDSNPVGNYSVPSAVALKDNVANGGTIGTVDITPAQNKQVLADKARVKGDDITKVIQLDFTTIGYPRLTPGIVEISGIGLRYSGKYRIMNVTHTIDNSGYVTKCMATSQVISGGGVAVEDLTKAQEDDLKNRRVLDTDPLLQLQKLDGIK